MGYNSTFSGSLHPNKPIPDELIQEINDKDLDLVVAGKDCDQGDAGDVVPWSSEMHGYNIAGDIVRIQRMLDPYRIKLSGEITRYGESGDDFELIEVVKGRVYTRTGEVKYGKRTPVDIDKWVLMVMTASKNPKQVGWVCRESQDKMVQRLNHGSMPHDVYMFDTESDALAAARLLQSKSRKQVLTKVEEPR